MDMIGLSASEIALCDTIYVVADSYWRFKDGVLAGTEVHKPVDSACHSLRQLLEKVGNSGNFHLLVEAERVICEVDLKHFQNAHQDDFDSYSQNIILRSLQEGAAHMNEVNSKLANRAKNARLFHKYSSETRMIQGEHDRQGLPKDAIRKILPSHRTRLENKSRGMDGASKEELHLIAARRLNVGKAERLYKALQRDALGIDYTPKI